MTNLRGGKVKLAALLVGLLLIGAGAGFMAAKVALRAGGKAKSAPAQTDKKESKSQHQQAEANTQVVPVGEFLLNVDGGGQLRYVKCDIALELAGLPEHKDKGHGGDQGPLTTAEEAYVKDAIVRVFASTPFAELQTEAGREKLRQALAAKIEKALQGPTVKRVLFTSFVMQ
jgi:flagellar basal body-associated protein FliL